jgi:putative phage-type endonuclease
MINDLELLEDISHTLLFYDEPSIFTEESTIEIVESALHLMNDYIRDNPDDIYDPNIHEILLDEIKDIFYIQLEDSFFSLTNDEDMEEDMHEILEDAVNIFITLFCSERLENDELNSIEKQINYLKNFPQPTQRTNEWYKFRHNLITASNAYKAFENQPVINQLIYEKCQPLKNETDVEDQKPVNTNSPLHWGQKYEPLSVLFYEHNNNTKVEEFGCIQHSEYNFLGASPDGIITDKSSNLYGRMLEIKNVVSRVINGIPKKEYWIQMQLQMEVCNLNECDFLETKFIEYEDSESYNTDTKPNFSNKSISIDGKPKGIIIYFNKLDGNPFYVYKPLELVNENDILEWEETNIQLYQSEKFNYTFVKFIYWKLEVLSCVLVQRDRDWFENHIEQLSNVWKIIEQERNSGYEHRSPMKRKKESMKPSFENKSLGCLLNFNKIIKTY